MDSTTRISTNNIHTIVNYFTDVKMDDVIGMGRQSLAVDNFNETVSVYSVCPTKFKIYSDTSFLNSINNESRYFRIPDVLSIEHIADVEIINDHLMKKYNGVSPCIIKREFGFSLHKYIMPKYMQLDEKNLGYNTPIFNKFVDCVDFLARNDSPCHFENNIPFIEFSSWDTQDDLTRFLKIIFKKMSADFDIKFDVYDESNFFKHKDGRILLLDLFTSQRLGMCWYKNNQI